METEKSALEWKLSESEQKSCPMGLNHVQNRPVVFFAHYRPLLLITK